MSSSMTFAKIYDGALESRNASKRFKTFDDFGFLDL